jgi:O-methyltransferase involved in polyketide biosynthesis
MPTTPNTHQSAQAVNPEAHVAYVDTDAVVLAHLRALAAQGNPGVTVIDGDVRQRDVILDAVRPGIDLAQPVCLLMGALLHFFPADEARDLVAGYATTLAPGSYVVLSVGRADGDAEAKGFGTYSSTGAAQAYNHSVAEFTGFFGPLSLVPPGVADAREWHPDDEQPTPLPPRPGQSLVGVARVG